MADAIDMVTWEEEKEELRELKMPVIRMTGGDKARALQVSEIQNSVGGCYVWQTNKSSTHDIMTLGKIRRAGGNLVSIDDQRVWTNSEVLRHRIMIEKERRDWRKRRGIKEEVISWGLLFNNAIREQIVRRESKVDCNLIAAGCQPRRIYYGEDEI